MLAYRRLEWYFFVWGLAMDLWELMFEAVWNRLKGFWQWLKWYHLYLRHCYWEWQDWWQGLDEDTDTSYSDYNSE